MIRHLTPMQFSQSRGIRHEYPGPHDPDNFLSWGRPRLVPEETVRLQLQLDLEYHQEHNAVAIQDLLAALRAIREAAQ